MLEAIFGHANFEASRNDNSHFPFRGVVAPEILRCEGSEGLSGPRRVSREEVQYYITKLETVNKNRIYHPCI